MSEFVAPCRTIRTVRASYLNQRVHNRSWYSTSSLDEHEKWCILMSLETIKKIRRLRFSYSKERIQNIITTGVMVEHIDLLNAFLN